MLGVMLESSSESDEDVPLPQVDIKRDIVDEVTKYRSKKKPSNNSNPLDFWRDNEKRFPLLSSISKKYLAVMATSTTAERVFSTLGLVLTKRRLSLTGENVNKLLFLSDKLKN